MELERSGLYRLFIRQDRTTWAGIVLAAIVTGLLQGGIIVVINDAAAAVSTGGLNVRDLLMFLVLLCAYSLVSHYSTSRTIELTEQATFATYVEIADKLRRAQLLDFERMGKSRIYSTLHTSTDIILETSKSLASVLTACVLILFAGLYIAYLSPLAIITIIVFYLFGVLVYISNLRNVRSLLHETDRLERRFKDLFKYFLEGFKEIKVDRRKGDALFQDHVRPAARRAEESQVRSERQLTINGVFVQSFYYFLVASVIFLLPRISDLGLEDLLKIAAVVLFTYGSMTRIVQSIPLILKAEKAIAALDSLRGDLEAAHDRSTGTYSGRFSGIHGADSTIRLEDATFAYQAHATAPHFTLGPLSLSIPPGELLFVVGGNGSGKTTLLKLLAGLYRPEEGALLLGASHIDDDNYADYRNLFAVVFPDYYLFDRFYGRPELDEGLLRQALRIVGLGDLVDWKDGRFGNLNLSAGQRKRLALVCARMDDSPILVLDEVAADLDPEFRRFFYESYLQELKSTGKTIIAVSHDEKYFHVADRVIKLDAGRIVH